MDHILRDTAGDERHNVVAQHKRSTILAKRCLGVITLLEDFVGPSDSIRTRRSRTGKEVFRAPPCSGDMAFGCSLARMQSSASRNIYNRGKGRWRAGVEGGAMCHRRAINKVQTNREQRDGRIAGSWNDLGGWCCSFDKSLSCESKRAPVPAVDSGHTAGNKTNIPLGRHRCWINIPILRPELDSSCAPTQGFAHMRVLLAAPYHRNTHRNTSSPHLTNVAIAFARVPSLSYGMHIMMCIYWFVSLGGGKTGTLCSNLTVQLLPNRIDCIIN